MELDFSHLKKTFSEGEKSSTEEVDCDLFTRSSVCPLNIDNVIMIDSKNVESEHQCQYKCFRDKQCQHFTYFAKGEIKKCVLFKECETMENCRYDIWKPLFGIHWHFVVFDR